MRIGVLPCLEGAYGGIYQYSLAFLGALEAITTDEFILLTDDLAQAPLQSFVSRGWVVREMTSSTSAKPPLERAVRRLIGQGRLRQTLRKVRARRQSRPSGNHVIPDINTIQRRPELEILWRQLGIDLMLYPTPTPLAFEVGIPFVMAVHDIQHRLQPEFPEVAADGEWDRREYVYRHSARHATLLLVNSEVSKDDFIYCYGPYGAAAERVRLLPYVPAPYLSGVQSEGARRLVSAKYHLPKRYIFSPGQFWPHKNHARIVEALEHLKLAHSVEIPIVFCGSATGDIRQQHFDLVMRMATHCGVANQVHCLGYVPNEDMSALYAGATALLAPSLFGPNHIPPLEAWASGCPVLTSDIRGIREQAGGAALLVDPHSVRALADGINEMWTDEALRQRLVEQGRVRVHSYTNVHFQHRLAEILEEAKARLGRAA